MVREAILRWFEDVPERQLPVQGVLGGTMGASVVAFPPDFSGAVGDYFFAYLDDGHYLATYRYQVTPAQFWTAGDVVKQDGFRWERLLKRGFEVWHISRDGYVPYLD